jgi:mannan endo-1,4-beta-mannosidase
MDALLARYPHTYSNRSQGELSGPAHRTHSSGLAMRRPLDCRHGPTPLYIPSIDMIHLLFPSRVRLIFALPLCAFTLTGACVCQFEHFITAKKDKLMEGDRELRFISVNIPNLHYLEDYLPFAGTNPWRLPDEFEIRDALTTVKQIGGKVARIYVFSVRREDDSPHIIRHVEGPGEFNEEAFKTFDRVLQIANEVGIRLIIPFVDNWRWWGGPREYASFRNKARDDFWTDRQLIEDFEKTIDFVLSRTNTLTGVPYKEDKAILAWETGNELQAPFSWTKEIAAYIKSLDTNHLLVQGIASPELTEEALDDPHLDVLSTHHYRNPQTSLEWIVKNQQLARGKKPYFVGEYGIVPTEDIRILTDTIINQGLAGGLIWSLRFRNREGGFYHHYEYSNVGAYRWPGFANGETYDERIVLAILREKAWQIDGLTAPRIPVPTAPELLDIKNVSEISWRGSVGAGSYIVERRAAGESSWSVVGDAIDESRYQYRPLFSDETAEVGKQYFYRVKAKNDAGTSDVSNEVGPVKVTTQRFIDEMENFDHVFQKDGLLRLLTYQDIRRAKEDKSRLTGTEMSYIMYKVPSSTDTVSVDVLADDTSGSVRLFTSADGVTFARANTQKEVFSFGENDYRFFHAIRIRANSVPEGTLYVKIVLDGTVQIGRVEISSH